MNYTTLKISLGGVQTMDTHTEAYFRANTHKQAFACTHTHSCTQATQTHTTLYFYEFDNFRYLI